MLLAAQHDEVPIIWPPNVTVNLTGLVLILIIVFVWAWFWKRRFRRHEAEKLEAAQRAAREAVERERVMVGEALDRSMVVERILGSVPPAARRAIEESFEAFGEPRLPAPTALIVWTFEDERGRAQYYARFSREHLSDVLAQLAQEFPAVRSRMLTLLPKTDTDLAG